MSQLELLIDDGVHWLTCALAGRMLGVSRQRVWQLLKAGQLRGEKRGGITLVASSSVRARIESLKTEGAK